MQRIVKLVAALCLAAVPGTEAAAGLRGRELTSNADAGTSSYVLSNLGTDLKRGEWDGSGGTDFAACQAKAASAQASFFAWTDEVYQPGFCKVLNTAFNSNPDLTTDQQGYGFKLFEAPGVIDEVPTPYSPELQALTEKTRAAAAAAAKAAAQAALEKEVAALHRQIAAKEGEMAQQQIAGEALVEKLKARVRALEAVLMGEERWCKDTQKTYGIRPLKNWGSLKGQKTKDTWDSYKCNTRMVKIETWCKKTRKDYGVVNQITWAASSYFFTGHVQSWGKLKDQEAKDTWDSYDCNSKPYFKVYPGITYYDIDGNQVYAGHTNW